MSITTIAYESGNFGGPKPAFTYAGDIHFYIIDEDITFSVRFKNEAEIIDKTFKPTKEQAQAVIALFEKHRLSDTLTALLNGKEVETVPPVFEGTDYCTFSATINEVSLQMREQKQIAAPIAAFAKELYDFIGTLGEPVSDYSKRF